jgi:hypothetical protein
MEEEQSREWPKDIVWWHKITDKSVDIAVQQTETYLKETVVSAQSIQDRADKLVGLLTPTLSAILVYLLSSTKSIIDILHITGATFLCFLVWAFFYLYRNITPYEVCVPGSYADQYINSETIGKDDEPHEQYLQIALAICSQNKSRAQLNDSNNKVRSKRNQKAITTVVIGLIFSPILSLLIHHLYVSYF